MSDDKCKAVIPGVFWGRTVHCNNTAKRDGYCGVHHPDAKKARREKWNKKYDEETARRRDVVATRDAEITQAAYEIMRAGNCKWSCLPGVGGPGYVCFAQKKQLVEKNMADYPPCAEHYTSCPLHESAKEAGRLHKKGTNE